MTTPTPKQGEIWLIRFDPSVGSEMKKTRPALIVGANDVGILPLCIVVPITNWDDAYRNLPWFVPLTPSPASGLTKPSGADTFQVKSVSRERLVERRGRIAGEQFRKVIRAINLCLEPGDDLDE